MNKETKEIFNHKWWDLACNVCMWRPDKGKPHPSTYMIFSNNEWICPNCGTRHEWGEEIDNE